MHVAFGMYDNKPFAETSPPLIGIKRWDHLLSRDKRTTGPKFAAPIALMDVPGFGISVAPSIIGIAVGIIEFTIGAGFSCQFIDPSLINFYLGAIWLAYPDRNNCTWQRSGNPLFQLVL
jgi:hypothetical protein